MPTQLKPVLFVSLTGLLLFLIFTTNIGNYYASSDLPEDLSSAVAWNSNAKALYKSAFYSEPGDEKQSLLEQSIQLNPANSFAVLQYVAGFPDDESNAQRSQILIEMASALRPADGRVQTQAASYWAERGEWLRALELWDKALGLTHKYDEALFPVLLQVIQQALSDVWLRAWVQDAGAWWGRFFGYLARQQNSLALMEALFEIRLSKVENIRLSERKTLIQQTQRAGQWDKAYLHWLNSLDNKQRTHIGLLFNGGFELPVANYGFGWRLLRGPALLETGYTTGVNGQKGLHLVFRGKEQPFHHVKQRLSLLPGKYLFQGRGRAQSLRGIHSLYWELHCLHPQRQALASSRGFTGTTPWEHFQLQFELPETCRIQELVLKVGGRNGVEQRLQGEAWFDELGIKRL